MSRPLRVGVVVPGWSEPGEGPVLPALQDLLWVLAREHELRVVALRHPPRHLPYVDIGGVSVQPVGAGARGGPLGRGAVLAAGFRALLRLHAERPFDVLHGFWADEPGAVAVVAARRLGLPVAVSVMGGELAAHVGIGYGAALGRGGRWGAQVALRGADLVTVGSSWLFRDVAPRTPDVPLRRLPLGVDLDRFAPASEPQAGSGRVLFVGSLTPVKDPVLLMRAFARVRSPAAELVIAGDGPLRNGLERLAAELGIRGRVRFLGAVPRDELPAVYRSAHVLGVTSRHEAQSMVAVEAAASAVPVVGTLVGIVPELDAAGGAIAVPEATPTALAEALDVALGAATRARLGAAARAHAVRAWDLRLTSARLSSAWQELVAEPEVT